MTRSPAALTARLAALAAAAGLGVALLYVLAVRTGDGRRLDDLTWGSFAPGSRAVEGTKDLLNTISVSSLALLGLAIMAVALLRARPRVALGAGVLVLGANLTTQWLKATLGRPGLDEAGTYPSGHVTVAMSLAMALVLVAPPWARPVAALLGTAYASAIGVGVIAASWHRPSDVVGAYLVVVGWTAAVTAVLAGPAGAGELRRGAPTARRTAGLGAAAAASHADLVRHADDRTAFAAAAVLCVCACAALATAVTVLVGRASAAPAEAVGAITEDRAR